MKKLLFISPTFPFPEDRGWNVRVANILKACGANYEVTLVAPEPDSHRDQHINFSKHFVGVEKGEDGAANAKTGVLSRLVGKISSAGRGNQRLYEQAISRVDLDAFHLIWV